MEGVRSPAVAGTFYQLGEDMLTEQTDRLLASTKEKPRFRAVISPHAGYVYSGKTAAKAIASLLPAKTFVILGPNHTGLGTAFSLYYGRAWETPLGLVPVDNATGTKLCSESVVKDTLAHYQEHSIEVQLPIMQRRFQGFSIVPISILSISYDRAFLSDCMALGERIAALGDVGIIASSDFSHYVHADEARKKDATAMKSIMALDAPGFFRALESTDASVCGYGPIAVLLAAAKKLGLKAHAVASSSSGDVSGKKDNVVSYHAVGFK